MAPVPVFFGLVNPFGSVWSVVGGLVFNHGATQSLVYVAPSLYAGFSWTDTTGMLLAAEVPRSTGYIKSLSMNLLAAVPTAIGATNAIYFCDEFWTNPATYSGFRVRLAGSSANNGTNAGAFHTNANNAATDTNANVSSPLNRATHSTSPELFEQMRDGYDYRVEFF